MAVKKKAKLKIKGRGRKPAYEIPAIAAGLTGIAGILAAQADREKKRKKAKEAKREREREWSRTSKRGLKYFYDRDDERRKSSRAGRVSEAARERLRKAAVREHEQMMAEDKADIPRIPYGRREMIEKARERVRERNRSKLRGDRIDRAKRKKRIFGG